MNNNPVAKLIASVLESKIPLFILLFSLFAGVLSLNLTPREEEPQIVVPVIDVFVSVPGTNAKQVERLVTTPLEKLLAQVSGVEHVYSSSHNGKAVVTLRFYVGENRELAILNTYNKLHSNADKVPAPVSNWLVKPVEVDDVPIVMLGLWSDDPQLVDDFQLKRLSEEVATYLQGIENTSVVNVVGGRERVIEIHLQPEKMAARNIAMQDVFYALSASNERTYHQGISLNHQNVMLVSGDVYKDLNELAQTPVSVINNTVVQLQDVASFHDGPQEAENYSWIDFNPAHLNQTQQDRPLVTISVAKQKGSNAVQVSRAVHEKIAQLSESVFPKQVHVEVLRDYGQTANEKVNDLTSSLAFAVFTVVVFIGVFLGWRPAMVVGLAVPICYGFTLALDLAFGYTINRVTLFALILSLGLLVDDPITGVDNIERYLKKGKGKLTDNIVGAINEIRVPLLMSTLTIVLAFVPLAFITGMMGPYMAPMAFNVPMSVLISTLVAFLVTPWLGAKLLKVKPETNSSTANQQATTEQADSGFEKFYYRLLAPVLADRKKAKLLLVFVVILFVLAALLPVFRAVPLKLLPFDNKNEVQILIEMPESSTLEATAAMAKKVSTLAQKLPEITAVANYVGLASPIDFNGMVRNYQLRQNAYQADLRLLLVDKREREHQSHAVVLRLREILKPLITDGIHISVIEVPPGPPVMSTLVAELYGDEFTPYQNLIVAADVVKARLSKEAHVVEVDSSVRGEQSQLVYTTNKAKAALSGISTQDINQVLKVANQGQVGGYFHLDNEATPLAIKVKLPLAERSSIESLNRLIVKGKLGSVQSLSENGIDVSAQPLVTLGELGQFTKQSHEQPIFHKDLKPVVYVTADISGRTPAEVIADISADLIADQQTMPSSEKSRPWQERSFLSSGGGDYWQLPSNIDLVWSGEGEWKITIRVFRDMGLAFLFALIAIYAVLRVQTASAALSLIIMSAIPLTIIGIMPGFLLLNQFGEREIAAAPEPVLFTATAMIGMIALAGIVVRNSLILVEFITQARSQGAEIKTALLTAGAVRMRPVLLTAGTTLLGNLIITLDPVFSGLAVAIIFGIIASTVFTLFVVPVVYLLVFDRPQLESVEAGEEIHLHQSNQPSKQ